ncbi:putative sensory transduction regulator [Jatrophihabitans sp. GAS493]|uniref:YbjN domain-containing protein n=1 Tax=Jatrophihabitans sp. GAS493 TaxID=1907575 RepID=UPI000BB7C325|nr:YbjN domain-containing protein [Jatrophihabitans sp. GAS493]SOD70685.1 putative sensory transduction regulator [Jatrophihabitans sp. GAS493]
MSDSSAKAGGRAAERSAVAATIEAALIEGGLQFERISDLEFAVNLPGERRLKTACILTVGEHALSIEAFVVRKPDENREQFYGFLLRHNARLYAVSWSIDDTGDVYLTGRVPLHSVTAEEIDRILGSVLEYADNNFNTLLKIGFGSSIRREWAWRVKNGESLANLQAFADFAQRAPADEPPTTEA